MNNLPILLQICFSLSFTFIVFSCASVSQKPVAQKVVSKVLNQVSYGQDVLRKEASASAYKTSGICNGLPKVPVKTAPGFCVGLVDNGEGLVKPRYTYQLDANHLLVSDMGGWKANNGKFYLLTFSNNKWNRKLFFDASTSSAAKKCILDRPHQIVAGPDNQIFLTSASCIATMRWPVTETVDKSISIKITGLPTDGLHSGKVIVFDQQGAMYVNIGSITDNCELETTDRCQEIEGVSARAVIRKYTRLSDQSYDPNFEIYARGQRNSMAMFWDEKTQVLWAGENARDYIDRKDSALNGNEKPSDEFNLIQKDDQLDWPYCYDDGKRSPEFPNADCTAYKKPHLLFPAHASPLGFLMYTGKQFPKWYQNRLLISFHGYATYGHRIVTYKRNDLLQPVGEPLSVVYGWNATAGQSVGSPVGITQALDGSVFITEDNSQKILQLYYDPKLGDGTPVAELKLGSMPIDNSQLAINFKKAEEKRRIVMEAKLQKSEVSLFSQIQNKLIDQNCTMCHGSLSYPGMQILKYDDVGNYKKLKDQLWPRLQGQGMAQMPPGGILTNKDELFALVQKWIQAGSPPP